VFASAVEKAGIGFIGPRAETMDAMGGKIAAKLLAESVNVPTLPWARVEAGAEAHAGGGLGGLAGPSGIVRAVPSAAHALHQSGRRQERCSGAVGAREVGLLVGDGRLPSPFTDSTDSMALICCQ
jgi:hypothetical protein